MFDSLPPSAVRTSFDIPRTACFTPLGSAGGFSGASLWQVETIDEVFCLRRWPVEHPDREHLEWIHRVMSYARMDGCAFIEALQKTRENAGGSSIYEFEGNLWQLSEWMTGTADFHENPSGQRLKNAMSSLAAFHKSAACVTLDFRPSPNLQARVRLLNEFHANFDRIVQAKSGLEQLPESIAADTLSLFQSLQSKGPTAAEELARTLTPVAEKTYPIQPVLRDVWHDHLLFSGDQVTGIVDFGAMQQDTVALDISRLLNSLVPDCEDSKRTGLDAYSEIRKLSPDERDWTDLHGKTISLLGSLNWLTWLLVDQRQFENMEDVAKRLRILNGQLIKLER